MSENEHFVGKSAPVENRPPLLKMTGALVAAAVAQRQPKMALQFMAKGIQSARTLPPAEQFDLAIGVVEEAAAEIKQLFVVRVLGLEATD